MDKLKIVKTAAVVGTAAIAITTTVVFVKKYIIPIGLAVVAFAIGSTVGMLSRAKKSKLFNDD